MSGEYKRAKYPHTTDDSKRPEPYSPPAADKLDEMFREAFLESSSLVKKAWERGQDTRKSVALCVWLACELCREIEDMYFDPELRPIVREIASKRSFFPIRFTQHGASKGVPGTEGERWRFEVMRKELKLLPQPFRKAHSDDELQGDIKTFIWAVYYPSLIRVRRAILWPQASAKSSADAQQWRIAPDAQNLVDPMLREKLLLPENRRNATLWAEAFQETMILVSPEKFALGALYHQLASQRLRSLQKSRDEKSFSRAFQHKCAERFKKLLLVD